MKIRARILDGRGRDEVGCVRIGDDGVIADWKAGGGGDDALVVPGLVDLSAGFGGVATVADEMRAALASGTTTACCRIDKALVLDSPAAVGALSDLAPEGSRILPVCAATEGLEGEHMTEMAMLKEVGCVAVGNGPYPYADAHTLLQILKYATHLDLPVFIHPRDDSLAAGGCAHDGPVATRLGLPGVPAVSETTSLVRCLMLAEDVGARVHFCRLSCARSVELIDDAKSRGMPVTADVAVHQLFFTEEDLLSFDTNYHVHPPYRGAADRRALRDGVRDGVIDAVCSDHRPCSPETKQTPFPDSRPGVATAQLLLPLMLALADDGVLPLQRAIEAVSVAPARLLGLEMSLDKGAVADLCVLERETWRPDDVEWFSRGVNHPFGETEFNWRVKQTIANGVAYAPNG